MIWKRQKPSQNIYSKPNLKKSNNENKAIQEQHLNESTEFLTSLTWFVFQSKNTVPGFFLTMLNLIRFGKVWQRKYYQAIFI